MRGQMSRCYYRSSLLLLWCYFQCCYSEQELRGDCPRIGTFLHGLALNTKPDPEFVFQCDPDYKMEGKKKIKCIAGPDGKSVLEFPRPKCIMTQACKPVNDFLPDESTVLNQSPAKLGDQRTVVCDNPKYPISGGSNPIVCNNDGEYTGLSGMKCEGAGNNNLILGILGGIFGLLFIIDAYRCKRKKKGILKKLQKKLKLGGK